MPVRRDCRHYSTRTVGGDVVQRCRVGANQQAPFACPEHCLFFEPRSLASGVWADPAVSETKVDPGTGSGTRPPRGPDGRRQGTADGAGDGA